MPTTTALTNLSTSASVAIPNSAVLSVSSEILSGLGFPDQRAAMTSEDQVQRENYLKLRDAIEMFEEKPDLNNQAKLIKILDKEINRFKAEHTHLKAKQAAYQRAAQKTSFGWSGWLLSSIKQFLIDKLGEAKHSVPIAIKAASSIQSNAYATSAGVAPSPPSSPQAATAASSSIAPTVANLTL
jgi:hypothetical protein